MVQGGVWIMVVMSLTWATMRYDRWFMHGHSEGTVTATGGLTPSRS